MVFSMGNFIFDNPTLDRRESMIFHTALKGIGPLRHVTKIEIDPVMIDRKSRFPILARGAEGKRWRKRLATLVGPGVVIRPEPPVVQASTP
jgi:hypothetical protein